ncbi:MAG: hypothetical protein ACFFG0_07350 [Candidatus Thorarchaeota archaeon]
MKYRLYLLNFCIYLLIFSGIVLKINAFSYKPGIKENDELIWKCKVCNDAEMSIIFGPGWDNSGIFQNLSEGTKMKWEINTVEINETVINIKFSIWFWLQNKNWGLKDIDSQILYLKNPNDYTKELNFSEYSSFVPFWFPIPVGEYMGGLSLNEWYDVDNRVLPTLNVDIARDSILPGYPNKSIKIIAIYNDDGILSSFKLYIKENVVIIDIALDFLPIYVLPTLVILFAILSLGVIVYIIRKYKSTRLLSQN